MEQNLTDAPSHSAGTGMYIERVSTEHHASYWTYMDIGSNSSSYIRFNKRSLFISVEFILKNQTFFLRHFFNLTYKRFFIEQYSMYAAASLVDTTFQLCKYTRMCTTDNADFCSRTTFS
jgi:hypothetical protein